MSTNSNMSNTDMIRYSLEVANQEYNGRLDVLMDKLKGGINESRI